MCVDCWRWRPRSVYHTKVCVFFCVVDAASEKLHFFVAFWVGFGGRNSIAYSSIDGTHNRDVGCGFLGGRKWKIEAAVLYAQRLNKFCWAASGEHLLPRLLLFFV